MIAYALFAMVVVNTTIPDTGIILTSLEWSLTPISVHETWQKCRYAEYDAAGFKRRLSSTEYLQYSPVLKCKKVNMQ
jgi:hypothetical protein